MAAVSKRPKPQVEASKAASSQKSNLVYLFGEYKLVVVLVLNNYNRRKVGVGEVLLPFPRLPQLLLLNTVVVSRCQWNVVTNM